VRGSGGGLLRARLEDPMPIGITTAAPDATLRSSFLVAPCVAGELGRSAAARGVAVFDTI